ncbi:hypothetical protein ScPMuIL_006923 [Solemya velum]
MEEDELDTNPLFKALQTSYVELFEKVQDGCLICIPQTISMTGVSVNQKFVETHVLRPSPYFKGQYVTLHSSKVKTVHYENSTRLLTTGDGFPQQCQIQILSEELGYNKNYQPYKILIIERPLDSSLLPKKASFTQNAAKSITVPTSYIESHTFLSSLPKVDKVLSRLDESIAQFSTNYMVLKEYLGDAAKRLQEIHLQYVQLCIDECSQDLLSSSMFHDAVFTAMENYIMASVKKKLFSVICDRCEREDRLLEQRCNQLTGVSMEKLGVRKELACPVPTAVVELASLDIFTTPLEKIHCVKSTIDNITTSIDSFIQANQNPEILLEDIPCVTSDDLIPLLVMVIAKSQCRYLASNVFYMENFHWSANGRGQDNLSYCLVTLKAALEYLKTTDFSYVKGLSRSTSTAEKQKEVSLRDLTQKSKEFALKTKSDVQIKTGSVRSQSKNEMDEQMDWVSQMVVQTNPTPRTAGSVFGSQYEIKKIPDIQPKSSSLQTELKRNQMGAFLISQDDDIFGMSFGKQT